MQSISLFGFAVDCSGDGSILAVGAKDALNEVGDDTGAVYLYSLIDFSKGIVAIETDDGSEIKPEPFTVLYGKVGGSEFGNAVALSTDGKVLVIGSRSENQEMGAIRIYEISENVAVMKSEILALTPEGGRTGWSVAVSMFSRFLQLNLHLLYQSSILSFFMHQVSGDGTLVATGATKGGFEGGGFVQTYRYQDSNWAPFLPGLDTLQGSDIFGFSLALSFDGTVMAVGSVKGDSLTPRVRDSGRVDIYAHDGYAWILRENLFGDIKLGTFGASVSLSQDGRILVVGESTFTYDDNALAGRCKIYEWNGSHYMLMHVIVGQYKQEKLGTSTAISDNGSIIACGGIGGRMNEIPSAESGVVRLWNKLTEQEKSIWPRGKFRHQLDGASFGSAVTLSANGKLLYSGASTWRGSDESTPGGVHLFDTYW